MRKQNEKKKGKGIGIIEKVLNKIQKYSKKLRKYDRERNRKCKEGKVKTIKDMNDRDKRRQRKRWAAARGKYRQTRN